MAEGMVNKNNVHPIKADLDVADQLITGRPPPTINIHATTDSKHASRLKRKAGGEVINMLRRAVESMRNHFIVN